MSFFVAACIGLTLFTTIPKLYGQSAYQQSASVQNFRIKKPAVRKTSTISGPLHYPIASLEKSLNKRFTDLLYKDESYFNNNNDGVISYALKSGDIDVSIEKGGIVKTRVPMTIKVSYRAFYPILVSFLFFKRSIIIDQEREFIFDIIVHFDSKAEIQENLSVKAKTTYKIDWITTPYVVLYKFFKFNLRAQVGEVFNRVFQGYSRKIDSVIVSQFDPQMYIKKIVTLFNQPLLIDDENKLWIKGELLPPVKVSPIKMLDKKFITLSLETKSTIDVFFAGNDKSAENFIPTTSATNVKALRRDVDSSLVYLDLKAYISPDALTSFIAKRAEESPIVIETGKLKAVITEIYFSHGNEIDSQVENKLVADVFLRNVEKDGSLGSQFQIKLFFVPVFNAKTGVLSVTSVDYELNTESLLFSFASLVASEYFKGALQEKITVSISSYIENIKEVIAKKVRNRRLSKNLSMRAKVDDVTVKSIVMQSQNIVVDFAINGNVEFYLDSLF